MGLDGITHEMGHLIGLAIRMRAFGMEIYSLVLLRCSRKDCPYLESSGGGLDELCHLQSVGIISHLVLVLSW